MPSRHSKNGKWPARNARVHSDEQIAQIAASINEWGWTAPVLVDENEQIIDGHGRVLAAQFLGLEDVPTMVADNWTDEQKRAYALEAGAYVALWHIADLPGLAAERRLNHQTRTFAILGDHNSFK